MQCTTCTDAHPLLLLKAGEAYSTLIRFNAQIQNLTLNLERFNNYIIIINDHYVSAHGLQQATSGGASVRGADPGEPPRQCQQPLG